MDRLRGRLQQATDLDQVDPGLKDAKCRLSALPSKVSWKIDYKKATGEMLRELQTLGSKMSAKKVQFCTSEVTYLASLLRGGTRSLSQKRIAAFLHIPTPKANRQAERVPRCSWILLPLEARVCGNRNASIHNHKRGH